MKSTLMTRFTVGAGMLVLAFVLLIALAVGIGRGLDADVIAYRSGDENYDIYVHDLRRGSRVNLTPDSPAHDMAPRWSPDGRQIAFFSNRDNGYALYVMELSDRSARQVAGFINGVPRWSDDGRWLVYGAQASFTEYQVYAIDAATGEARELDISDPLAQDYLQAEEGLISGQFPSPDRQTTLLIRLDGGSAVISVLRDNDRLQDLYRFRVRRSDRDYLRWSPDSTQIALVDYRSADVFGIHLMVVATGEGRWIADDFAAEPDWRP
jgi:Tol biopolymer transport system component